MTRIRIMKVALGSGVVSAGLLALTLTLTGCSGESAIPAEEAKIGGMTPGEYLDSQDVKPRAKGAKGAARPKH